jgi:hydrogenase maturation protein HypF
LLWGGEVLIASYANFERFAHLEYVPLPDGDTITNSLWGLAAGYAHVLDIDVEELPFLQNVHKKSLHRLRQPLDQRHRLPLTSSMGRLFDVVSCLVGIRSNITYKAQAAMEMEVLARPFVSSVKPYPYTIAKSESGTTIGIKELLLAIVQDVRANEPLGMTAARFHRTVSEFTLDVCKNARTITGLNEVVLSGGVWQNQILLNLVCDGLRQEKFVVYFHKQIPTNDGGLALGQAVIANHVRTAESESADECIRRGL